MAFDAPVTLRDYLQYVLPALLAACMYVPLVAPEGRVTAEGVIFGAVALSYIVWEPVYGLSHYLYKRLPILGPRYRAVLAERKEVARRWDYGKIRYTMTEGDREYVYSHGSFTTLYAAAGLHLFAYALINLALLAWAAFRPAPGGASAETALGAVSAAGLRVWQATTPTMGDFRVSTLFLFAASAALFYFSFTQYLFYYKLLFGEGGQYARLSEKYHATAGGIARELSGQVKYAAGESPFTGAKLTLVKKIDGAHLGYAVADARGEFLFPGCLAECEGAACEIHVDLTGTEAEGEVSGRKWVEEVKLKATDAPHVEIRIPKSPPPALESYTPYYLPRYVLVVRARRRLK